MEVVVCKRTDDVPIQLLKESEAEIQLDLNDTTLGRRKI